MSIKIPCGGFYVGDGLSVENNTLSVAGGAVWYVNVDVTGANSTDVIVDKTVAQIVKAYESAYVVYAKVRLYGQTESLLVPLSAVTKTGNNISFSSCGLNSSGKIIAFVLQGKIGAPGYPDEFNYNMRAIE